MGTGFDKIFIPRLYFYCDTNGNEYIVKRVYFGIQATNAVVILRVTHINSLPLYYSVEHHVIIAQNDLYKTSKYGAELEVLNFDQFYEKYY